jgi:hypothetical protein
MSRSVFCTSPQLQGELGKRLQDVEFTATRIECRQACIAAYCREREKDVTVGIRFLGEGCEGVRLCPVLSGHVPAALACHSS